jgi:hypothetical protein
MLGRGSQERKLNLDAADVDPGRRSGSGQNFQGLKMSRKGDETEVLRTEISGDLYGQGISRSVGLVIVFIS